MKITVYIDDQKVELEAPDHLEPREAAEFAYAKLNHGSGQELEGYKGRSLSVGDLVEVGPYTLRCEGAGWMFLTEAQADFCHKHLGERGYRFWDWNMVEGRPGA